MNLRTPRRPLLRGAASMLAAALVVACSTPDGQAAAAGIPFPELCERICRLSLERHAKRQQR